MNRKVWWVVLLVVAVVGLVVTGVTSARSSDAASPAETGGAGTRDVAETVWYQGFLADVDTGEPINDTFAIVARIFTVPSGGGALWGPETHNGVDVVEGWFNIELGSVIGALPAFDAPPYYVELTIDGEILQPRQKLASVPSALHTDSSDDGTQWYETYAGIAYADTVSIGTSWPSELFTIHPTGFSENGFLHFSPYVLLDGPRDEGSRVGEGALIGLTDNNPNLWIVNAEEDGWTWLGSSDYPWVALTDSFKFIVSPYAMMWPGSPHFFTVDGDGIGTHGAGFYADHGDDYSHVLHAEYYGDAAYATAVYGDATSGDQWTSGGEFYGNGYGIEAYAQGDNNDNWIYGVYGDADNGTNTASCYSIYGATPSGNGSNLYAGYFSGNTHVGGTFSKAAGSFKIDHPLDPANMYLQHSFVESPDMMNVYNGNVVLDGAGEATVVLPDYFDVLNHDFRYQLTPIGAPGPNLYIASEIAGNSFRIAGGEPGSKVSWQVTGVRQDRYAEEHRIAVEVPKEGYELGRYAHPEVFGLPTTMSVDYHEEIEARKAERAAANAELKAQQAARRERAKAAGTTEGSWRAN